MDSSHELRAEDIGEIGGYGGEAAAIHGQDHAEDRDEQGLATHMGSRRGQRHNSDDAQREEGVVRRLAAETVGQRCPEEAPANIEEREQARQSRQQSLQPRSFATASSCVKLTSGQSDQLAGEDLLQAWAKPYR